MLASQIPTKFPIPFGKNAAPGTIRPIPQASQTATSPGQASLTDGFPVATGQPLAAGGVPPAMQDFNGLLNQITAWNQWQATGAAVAFDLAFSNAIGGYPQGAIVASTTVTKLWLNTVDNNSTDPDSSGASGWVPVATTSAGIPSNTLIYNTPGTYSWTCPPGVTRVRVTLWAGGGGGGGTAASANSVASSGGAAEYRRGVFTVTPGVAYAITVGAGGAPGQGGSSPTAGGTGGLSSFSSLMTAIGGGGGIAANGAVQTSTGAGGTGGSGGTEANPGTGGGVAYAVSGGYVLSQGGAAYLGGTFTATKVASTALTGLDGNAPGGGAQGSILGNAGGTGGVGRVVLEF